MWDGDSSGAFTVKRLAAMIQTKILSETKVITPFKWNSWLPIKVNIRVWRIHLNRLPFRDNLAMWGIDIGSTWCILCNDGPENLEHIFVHWRKSMILWRKIWSWWSIIPPQTPSLSNIILGNSLTMESKWHDKAIKGVYYTVLWSIWNWRNRILYCIDQEAASKTLQKDLLPSIQLLTLTWIKYWSKRLNGDWNTWILNPRSLIRM